MTDKTKKIIYWTLFGTTCLVFIAAFAVGLVGIIKEIDLLTHLSIILVPIGLLINIINILIFKPNSKKSEPCYEASDKESK